MIFRTIRVCNRTASAVAIFLFFALSVPTNSYAQRFDYPQVGGMPMDGCFGFATDCGQPAAEFYCNMNGYTDAVNYATEASPSDTKTVLTRETCDTSQWICGKFSFIECATPHAEIAQLYAPVLALSSPGGPGIDLHNHNHPYTDYIPIDIYDITSDTTNLPAFHENGTSQPLDDTLLDNIGRPPHNDSLSYIELTPMWEGILPTVEDAYVQLALHPTVYYRVFRDHRQRLTIDENVTIAAPIAVQYWFFYFFNNWAIFDHPGDWESITVFLDGNKQPLQAAYSTHYEANRHSWMDPNVATYGGTHPLVYVSNGGHGSYNHAGDTQYQTIADNHRGDREVLLPADYDLISLVPLERTNGWVWFSGRWGNGETAPPGPLFRRDAMENRVNQKNQSYDRYCSKRTPTSIYWNPWLWGSGYGLDSKACRPATISGVPVITGSNIPLSIPGNGAPVDATLNFRDSDAGVDTARFIILADSCGGCVEPFAIDPGVSSITEGSIMFNIWCEGEASWAAEVRLEDSQGNVSDPHTFSVACGPAPTTELARP